MDEPGNAEKVCGCLIVTVGLIAAIGFGLVLLETVGNVVMDFLLWLDRWT